MISRFMLMLATVFMVLGLSSGVLAQDMPVLWSDYFRDTATDPAGVVSVGWLRFGPAQGLVNSSVVQTNDELVVTAGVFNNLAGVGLVQTNGVPFINPNDTTATKRALLRKPPYGAPNAVVTFKINFVNYNQFTAPPQPYFLAGVRMDFTDTTETIPNADPTVESAYALFVSPIGNLVRVGKYSGPLAGLNPAVWTYFGQATFTFTPNTYFWCKYYFNEADLKVKFWAGDSTAEPAAWLIEGTDPSPRVKGEWITLASVGTTTAAGFQFKIDNFTVRSPGPSAVADQPNAGPVDFALAQNYPNPFNPVTQIKYALSKAAFTTLEIYNTAGQKVRTLLRGHQTAGSHQTVFDGRDDRGQALSSGIYFYRLRSGELVAQKKMLFVK